METVIKTLQDCKDEIKERSKDFNTIALEHGSPDQTRAMVIESIFLQAENHVKMAIDQLNVLDKQLY